MTETSTFGAVAELTKRNKREVVATWRPGTPEGELDTTTHAVVVRGGEHVALVFAGPGPMGARRAGYLAASLMRPDELFMVVDSVRPVRPMSVEEAHAVSAADLFNQWTAGDRAGLTEALMLQRFVGGTLAEIIDYPYVRMGALLTWGEARVYEDMTQWGGAIVDSVAEGWRKGLSMFASGVLTETEALGVPVELADHFVDHLGAQRASAGDRGRVVLLECGATWINGEELPVIEGDELGGHGIA